MKTRFEIIVTQLDIDEGVRNNSHYCIVSTAIGRVVPEALRIIVDAQTIRFTVPDESRRWRLVYLTPRSVRDYIIAFDAGDEIEPFGFVLEKAQVTEMPTPNPNAARAVSFKAAGKGTGERRSLRVFGERSFRANQTA